MQDHMIRRLQHLGCSTKPETPKAQEALDCLVPKLLNPKDPKGPKTLHHLKAVNLPQHPKAAASQGRRTRA